MSLAVARLATIRTDPAQSQVASGVVHSPAHISRDTSIGNIN
jgi:hypothetical protein